VNNFSLNFSSFDAEKYNYKNGKFRDNKTGKFLSKKRIKELTVENIEIQLKKLSKIGSKLIKGKFLLQDWLRETAQALKNLHAQQFLLGVGGRNNIRFEDYLVLARTLKEQYKYLRKFAIDCKSGITPLRFKYRLRLYALSSRGSYFLGKKQAAKREGKTSAIRKLGVAEHCVDCLYYASLGAVSLEEAIMPTQQCACGPNCKCDIEFIEDEIAFSEGNFIIDKNGRWRDKNGRFIEMPDIEEPEQNSIVAASVKSNINKYKNIVRDIEKLKLLNLSTKNAYDATVDKLKRKYKNDATALSVINSLQFERGISNKKNAAAKVDVLRKIIDEVNSEGSRKLSVKTTSDKSVKTIPINDEAEFINLSKRVLNNSSKEFQQDKSAVAAINRYRNTVKEINEAIREVGNKSLTDSDYQRLYGKTAELWSKLKVSLEEVNDLQNNFYNEPLIDEYLGKIGEISRESPGGFKINIPDSIKDIKNIFKAEIC
jgi:hypothetical protein